MSTSTAKTVNRLLWATQVLVALLFLFAGVMKFVMPPERMQEGPVVLPLAFLYFIGVAECVGAVGLVVPAATGIRPMLTPLAAAGLTIIMIGATVVSAVGMGVAAGVFPAAVGLLTAWIAYSRARVEPLVVGPRSLPRAA